MQFTIKIYENDSIVQNVRTRKIRRFLKIIRSIKWSDSLIKTYVKLKSGKFTDNHGKYTDFYNDGTYGNKNDFWEAINAFLEN